MSYDPDDDPDSPAAAEDAAARAEIDRKITSLDACRQIIRGTMRGVTASAMFDPLVVIAALGYTLDDMASELLLLTAQQNGRVGYEEAKSATLNLYGLVHQQLVDKMQQLEKEMEREDRGRKIRKADVN